MLKAKTVIITTQNSLKLVDYLMFELKQNVGAKKFMHSVDLLNQCEELIY